MRVEYRVSSRKGKWRVQRGFTESLEYASRDAAIRVADTMARHAAAQGNSGVVTLQDDAGAQVLWSYGAERASPSGVEYDPERESQTRRSTPY